jgi:hypothetical protein
MPHVWEERGFVGQFGESRRTRKLTSLTLPYILPNPTPAC